MDDQNLLLSALDFPAIDMSECENIDDMMESIRDSMIRFSQFCETMTPEKLKAGMEKELVGDNPEDLYTVFIYDSTWKQCGDLLPVLHENTVQLWGVDGVVGEIVLDEDFEELIKLIQNFGVMGSIDETYVTLWLGDRAIVQESEFGLVVDARLVQEALYGNMEIPVCSVVQSKRDIAVNNCYHNFLNFVREDDADKTIVSFMDGDVIFRGDTCTGMNDFIIHVLCNRLLHFGKERKTVEFAAGQLEPRKLVGCQGRYIGYNTFWLKMDDSVVHRHMVGSFDRDDERMRRYSFMEKLHILKEDGFPVQSFNLDWDINDIIMEHARIQFYVDAQKQIRQLEGYNLIKDVLDIRFPQEIDILIENSIQKLKNKYPVG